MPLRCAPSLAELGETVARHAPRLAEAAREGQGSVGAARSSRLAAAVAASLPVECLPADTASPGSTELARACPPPAEWGLAPGLLSDLEPGVYLFARAAWGALEEAGCLQEGDRRLLFTLLLSCAIEAEASSESR